MKLLFQFFHIWNRTITQTRLGLVTYGGSRLGCTLLNISRSVSEREMRLAKSVLLAILPDVIIVC